MNRIKLFGGETWKVWLLGKRVRTTEIIMFKTEFLYQQQYDIKFWSLSVLNNTDSVQELGFWKDITQSYRFSKLSYLKTILKYFVTVLDYKHILKSSLYINSHMK
jgi:hypothetical protein